MMILTTKNGDGHRGVHKEQHVKEQETEVREYFGAVVADVVVESSYQEADQDVSEETKVHEGLWKEVHVNKGENYLSSGTLIKV